MQEEPMYSELMVRVARLERRNRWLMLGLALVGAFVVFVGATPQEADTITAQRFILEDSSGTEKGRWFLTEDAKPTLRLVEEERGNETEVSARGLRVREAGIGGGTASLHSSFLTIQDSLNILAFYAEDELVGEDVGPRITVYSPETGQATIGRVRLERGQTGSVEMRPTSSIILINKDGELIWEVPR